MKRELNPKLFGASVLSANELGRSIASIEDAAPTQTYNPEVYELKAELKNLRSDLLELEKESAHEISRVSQDASTIVQQFTALLEAAEQRIAGIEFRIQERENDQVEQAEVNQKIEQLLERHNQIVRNFENKLVHLTRVLSDQEMQILNSKAALEEAHSEILKLRS